MADLHTRPTSPTGVMGVESNNPIGGNVARDKRPERVYVYSGMIERPGKSHGKLTYVWREGWAQPDTFPWMTKAEAQAEAKRDGVKAVFVRG